MKKVLCTCPNWNSLSKTASCGSLHIARQCPACESIKLLLWTYVTPGHIFLYGECRKMKESALNVSAGRKNDLWKQNVSVGRLDFHISAWVGAIVLSRNWVHVCSISVMIMLVCWHVLSSPVWLCAGSPILVMSGMCWWELPRTWSWTHARLLGDLSTRTSWWIVVRSWSFCTRWERWLGRSQARCCNNCYFTLNATVIVLYSNLGKNIMLMVHIGSSLGENKLPPTESSGTSFAGLRIEHRSPKSLTHLIG